MNTLTRPLPSRPRDGSTALKSFVMLLSCLGIGNWFTYAEAAASEALLGGQYVPTTDVGFIEDLTLLIEAISTESDPTIGQSLYTKFTPNSDFSLESIGSSDSSTIINATTNPLYSIYMYGYYKSPNGSGSDSTKDRANMLFLEDPVDYYGHTIITNEFEKPSGYNATLNAETIRVTNMWMATVQSLYDAQALCDAGPGDWYDPLNDANPVDKAAAFYFGTHEDDTSSEGGSLFAWVARTREKFVSEAGFLVNDAMVYGLVTMQTMLDDCLALTGTEKTEKQYELNKLVNDLTQKMTIPLVQNLIYWANEVAQSNAEDKETEDFMILYALATLPPIMVCDKVTFNSLYEKLVSNPNQMDTTVFSEVITTLFNSFTCLGVTCEEVGIPQYITAPMSITMPTCEDTLGRMNLAGYEPTYDNMLMSAIVDLDLLAIGILVEMEANNAAFNVYWWNKYALSLSQSVTDVSLSDMANAVHHEQNTLAVEYSNEYDIYTLIENIILKKSDFEWNEATSVQRRELVEILLATVVLPVYALDSMYSAVDNCNNGQDSVEWDKAVATLIGYLEGPDDGGSEKGTLLYDIGQYLCSNANTCNDNGDAEVNRLLMNELKLGKQNLDSKQCTLASESIYTIEILFQVYIIDSLAYFATKVTLDSTDNISAANGYALATAFYPMVQRDETDETDNVIKDNLGSFISGDINGMGSIISTLETYITTHNGIDCKLLYNLGCATNATSGATTTIPNEVFMPSTTTMFPDGDVEYLYPSPAPIEGGTARPSSSTYNPTYTPSVTHQPSSSTVLSGGVMAINDGTVSAALYSGAYVPTSNIDHIIKLIEYLGEIEKPGSKETGLSFYQSEAEVGLSLQTLSTGSEWEYVRNINPLQIIYSYGLWISGDGDNDSNGYSNKRFDDGDIEKYGDTIVMDGFNKNSGYDEKLTAETIRVMNVWMAMVTELYKAVESCRDGSASTSEEGFNPVDHAAAFWYGSSEDKEPCFLPVCESENNAGLHDWADRAASNFVEQTLGVSDEIGTALTKLQSDYATCKSLSLTDSDEKSNTMRNDVLRITRLMTIPLVQNFITDLATKAGKAATERDYLILYSLSLLPQLSICDEDVLKALFNDLILENASFDGSKFSDTLKTLQDRYDCIGLTCSQIGKSTYSDSSWPVCVDRGDPSIILNIAGYTPFSKTSSELSRIDLDVSTILSFIVMEANDAAWEVYKHGRNVIGSDGNSSSLRSLKFPKSTSVLEIYDKFNGDYGIDYLWITESVMQAAGKFVATTPLQNSAAANIALVTMDLHIAILDNLHQALDSCRDGTDRLVVRALWDRAVALTVGWSEGQNEFGSDTDGYLFFQMAQELCALFDTCDINGNSETNKDLMSNFSTGAVVINESNCDSLEQNVKAIETLLQTILLDLLAYHIKEAETDSSHYLLAHVSTYALMPFMRTVDEDSADIIEQNLGTYPSNFYLTDGIEAVYYALKTYVDTKGIDCGLLSSAICEGITSSDVDKDTPAVPNDSGHTLAGGEYTPFTDVTTLAGISSVVNSICTSVDATTAKSQYSDNDAAGMTLQTMSLSAEKVMSEEIMFNQYIFAFFDEVDKTDGQLLFDGQPAGEYANTIVSDAIDDNINLGCESVKVLTLWMWVVHKLNDAVEECKEGDSTMYGSIDEAAAVWIGNPLSVEDEGGLLYELAEELGVHFSHDGGEYMTTLNREIISRMSFAQATYFVNSTRCKTDANAVTEVRKLVKEITSYMTAVLIQGFIHSMLETTRDAKEKEAFVELYAFAFLPHIERCGHSDLKDSLYDDLVVGSFAPVLIPSAIDAIHSQLNCLGLQCKDIGRHLLADESYPECFDHYDLVGYTPVNETRTNMPARIDLDAVAIHQLMSMEKYSVAKDVYMSGHNYFDYDNEKDFGFVSLHDLTQSATIGDTDFYEYTLFTGYLSQNPGDFADQLIIDALDQSGKFNKTTSKQRELAVATTIKSFVSFMSALEALNVAVSKCEFAPERAVIAWDGGAAFLIGSVEGTEDNAGAINSTSDGRMFYSISNKLCGHFDNCVGGAVSAVAEDLIALLTKGQGEITTRQCPEATATLESITQLCTVSLIQSALFFADESIDEDKLAAGYVASMAVLPLVNRIDPDAAMVIKEDMRFRTSSMDGDSTAVIDAFRTVLSNPLSHIECESISNIHRLCDTAPDLPASIDPSEASIFSNGLYTATNYVADRASISLDVKDIEDKIKSDWLEQAVDVYTNGANSPTYNSNGELSGKRSIAKLSTESSNNMKYNAIYNRFIYGLSDKSQAFLGRPVTNYADSFVRELLYAKERQEQLAAPGAMVVLNIWMQVIQKMNAAYIACKSPSSPSNPGDPSLLIDEAAAFWIGDSQDTGSSTQGHLLYALTEFVGEKYEDIPAGSQSTINTRVIDLFNQAKTHITMTKSCTSSPTSHMKMRSILEELIPLMAAPLLRGLFYYLSIRDTVKVRMYAVSVLPLFSTCSKSTYQELKSELIDNGGIDVDKDYIFSLIKELYDCIGVSCEMVGYMPRNNYTKCEHSATHDEVVGFSYAGDHDSIVEHSKIDVDIQDIEAFTENGVTIFPQDVEGLFDLAYSSYNKDTSSASLSNLARSTDRDVVPIFASFRRYFKDDLNYADTIINNAFQRQGIFSTASTNERRKVISFTTRYMVTHMAVLEKLYSSVDLCRDPLSKTEAYESLDAAAAYFIGFAEGEEDGGTYDGVLLYGLAKRMCVMFDTCSSTNNNAESNERIISLLYAAQGELDVGACDSLANTIKGIENSLVIPLIQATLYASRENELYVKKKDKYAIELFSEGYALSLSILPLINNADISAARDIAKVMVNGFPGDKVADHTKVFRAMQVAIPKMKDLDCEMVGTLDGVSFCEGAADVRSSGVLSRASHYLLGGLVLSMLFCC